MYKGLLSGVIIFGAVLGCSPKSDNPHGFSNEIMAQADKLAKETIIIDTHIDLPTRLHEEPEDISVSTKKGDFDYPRAVAGGLDAPFMSIYIPSKMDSTGESTAFANQLIDMMEKVIADAPDKFAKAYSVVDIKKNFAEGKMSLPLGMENGSPIDGNLKNLQHFYNRGIRYITLTHGLSNHISDSSYDENRQWGGLSDFGKTLVTEMNNIGMMVDVSHVSDEAFYDALEISAVPMLATHSSARYFTPGWERNISDELIKALSAKGGVVEINYGSAFLTKAANDYSDKRDIVRDQFMADNKLERDSAEVKAHMLKYKEQNPYPRATLNDVLDHFDHVVKIAGINHVGIGSDYEGVGDSLPSGLMDVSSYPTLIAGLLTRGYSEADIKKILSENTLRVWSAAEEYAESKKSVQ